MKNPRQEEVRPQVGALRTAEDRDGEFRLVAERVRRSDPLQEPVRRGAAAHRHVVTIVDELAGNVVAERGGTATEPRRPLEKDRSQPVSRQPAGRRDARKAAPNDGNRSLVSHNRFHRLARRIQTFSAFDRPIRSRKTSYPASRIRPRIRP